MKTQQFTHMFKNFFTNISRFGLNNVPNMCYNICIPAASDCLQKKFERENHGKKIFECDTRAFARIVKFKSGEFRI